MSQPLARSVVIAEISQVIGRTSAQKLVDALGGLRIYVPKEVGEDHELAQAIGVEAANRLADFYHGTRLLIPVGGRRRRKVRELGQSGMTRKDIAARTGYHERQVYRILGSADSGGPQPDLFDNDA